MASNINNEDLIEQVRKHNVIWDVKNPKHKNRQIVSNAWMGVSKALNATELECRNRWKSLRDNYQRLVSCQKSKRREVQQVLQFEHSSLWSKLVFSVIRLCQEKQYPMFRKLTLKKTTMSK